MVRSMLPHQPAGAADATGDLVFETLRVRKEAAVLFTEIAAPPMNLLGPELVRDLVSLIQRAEADNGIKLLVFKSADPDYFISHVDVTKIKEYREEAAKLTGEASIGLLFRYLSASRLITIAQIEGASEPLAASSYSRATCASQHKSGRFSARSNQRSVRFRAGVASNTSYGSWGGGERLRSC